jgi:cobalamin biosynthesis protein CbiD
MSFLKGIAQNMIDKYASKAENVCEAVEIVPAEDDPDHDFRLVGKNCTTKYGSIELKAEEGVTKVKSGGLSLPEGCKLE